MVVESSDLEIVITMAESNDYFDKVCQLRGEKGKKLNQRQIGALLGVHQTTISRNQRRRKKGLNITDELFEVIAEILRDWHIDRLREKHQRDQEEADRVADVQRQADEQADQRRRNARRIADKAESERRAGVHANLERYWARMPQDMFRGVDPATQGDAPALLDGAQPPDIAYPSHEMAMIALAPADFRFPCGQTGAQLREGRTAWHRLNGEYPKRKNTSEMVPSVLRPDADLHYQEDYEEILVWQRQNAEYRALVLEPLPLTLSPETAKAFHDFLGLDRALRRKGYSFLGSCLDECADVERRLQEINRRTILPIAGAGALEGLRWMGIAAVALAAIAVAGVMLFFGIWGLWELGKVAVEWVDRMRWYIGVAIAVGAVLAAALWWAWPRKSDQRNSPVANVAGWRLFTVASFTFLLAMAVVLIVYAVVQGNATGTDYTNIARTVSDGLSNQRIVVP